MLLLHVPISAISELVQRNGRVTGQELAKQIPSGHLAAREDKTDLNRSVNI